MTDYDPTPSISLSVLLWDHERDDECPAVLHGITRNGFPRLLIQSARGNHTVIGPDAIDLNMLPSGVDALITGLRARVYRARRSELSPKPRDVRGRRGRRPGPCPECDGTGWICLPTQRGGRRSLQCAAKPGTTMRYAWTPCPGCLNQEAQAA